MPETSGELRRINWSECFGFVRIFRSFRMSFHWAKLFPAFCAILATYCAGHLLDGLWPATSQPAVQTFGTQSRHELAVFLSGTGDAGKQTEEWLGELAKDAEGADKVKRVGVFKLLLQHARLTVNAITGSVIRADLGGIIGGFRYGFQGVVWLLSMHLGYAIVYYLVLVAIWAFFGGAICRAAVMHVSRDEKIHLREGFAFARSRFLRFAAAPIVPIGFVLVGALCLWIGGLVGAIPAVGEILVGLFFGLALLAGFFVALIIILGVAGFPLMMPAIAADNLDALDALSTTYSYVGSRPWKTAFYALVATCYGAICIVFVKLIVMIMLWAVGHCVGASMNWGDAYARNAEGESVKLSSKLDQMWQAPSFGADAPFYGTFPKHDLSHVSWFGRSCLKIWIYLLYGVVAALVVTLFYNVGAVIYFLLRRDVDMTDIEDVYLEDTEIGGPAATTQAQATPAAQPETPGPSSESV